jgi:hypothetical protein
MGLENDRLKKKCFYNFCELVRVFKTRISRPAIEGQPENLKN